MQKTPARPLAHALHRSMPEPMILDMLLLGGWVFECSAGRQVAARAECQDALEALVARGLGFEDGPTGIRLFDPAEVQAFITAEGLANHSPLWEERFVQTGRALYRSLGPAPHAVVATLTRTLNPKALPPHIIRPRITIPVPIACAYVEHPVATLSAPKHLEADITRRDTCFDIRLNAPPTAPLSFTATFGFTTQAQHGPQALTEAERSLYLRPAENFIRVTEPVEALARTLSARTLSPRRQVARTPENTIAAFYDFLLGHIQLGMVQYAAVPADAAGDFVLAHRWCDCLLAACLFISLCRAIDVPARLVGGHVLYPLAPARHYWAECWFGDAWVPYDFLAWDFSAAGRDQSWRDIFAGSCDARMVTEIFPSHFTGPMSWRLPRAWHLIQTRLPGGVATAYYDAITGTLIYRDEFTIARKADRPV